MRYYGRDKSCLADTELNLLDEGHDEGFLAQTVQKFVLMFVVGLFAHTKQAAHGNDTIAFPVPRM